MFRFYWILGLFWFSCLEKLFGLEIHVQNEAVLPLSILQEADEAIERGQRWLQHQTHTIKPIQNEQPWSLLRQYVLIPSGKTFHLHPCALTPIEQIMPPILSDHILTNLVTVLSQSTTSPQTLFALQRDLPNLPTPPPNWREKLTLTLINTQHCSAFGEGHWGNEEQTIWAILALRSLLNESPPIRLKSSQNKPQSQVLRISNNRNQLTPPKANNKAKPGL